MSNYPLDPQQQRDLLSAMRADLAEAANVRPLHEDDLPFTTCTECDDTRVVLKGHSTTHGWREEPYPCPYCAKGKR